MERSKNFIVLFIISFDICANNFLLTKKKKIHEESASLSATLYHQTDTYIFQTTREFQFQFNFTCKYTQVIYLDFPKPYYRLLSSPRPFNLLRPTWYSLIFLPLCVTEEIRHTDSFTCGNLVRCFPGFGYRTFRTCH